MVERGRRRWRVAQVGAAHADVWQLDLAPLRQVLLEILLRGDNDHPGARCAENLVNHRSLAVPLRVVGPPV